MLEQDSLEGSGTQGQGRAATAAQGSGLGMSDRKRRFSYPMGLAMWAAPPSQQLWGLQQQPLQETETHVEESLTILQG